MSETLARCPATGKICYPAAADAYAAIRAEARRKARPNPHGRRRPSTPDNVHKCLDGPAACGLFHITKGGHGR